MCDLVQYLHSTTRGRCSAKYERSCCVFFCCCPDLPPLHLPHLLQSGAVVHHCVLNDGQEDKQEAGPQVDVNRFHVGHLDDEDGDTQAQILMCSRGF